ncbi:Helix-turn-helix [uncultured archaeon]|nr:Helix-turn-helix [uncultured archaeon]
MEKLSRMIAGEILMAEDPGAAMKKWREIFDITQSDLAASMEITPSTISDYESNRRESPGIKVIKRFIETVMRIDKERGSPVLQKLAIEEKPNDAFEVRNFSTIVTGIDFQKMLDATILANGEMLEKKKVYGYTLLDSHKIIMDFQYNDFQKLYGSISERAFIFTNVSSGRSPMIAVKLAPIKPSLVAIHGLKKKDVDPLAIKIAEKDALPLLLLEGELPKIKETLSKY